MSEESSPLINDSRIAEIRTRAEHATPGPWIVLPTLSDEHVDEAGRTRAPHVVERRIATGWDHPQLKGPYGVVNNNVTILPVQGVKPHHGVSIDAKDAEFIAHAREDVPYLLSALEASEARVQKAEQEAVKVENGNR